MTAKIIQFPTKPTSHYFHPTTPNTTNTPARKKREILLSVGWSEYVGETVTVYTNPDVDNNSPYYLDNAWHEQLRIEMARKVFFS